MAIQRLDFGTAANNDGELIRTAFPKLDNNDADLDTRVTAAQADVDALEIDVATKTTAADVNTLISATIGTTVQAYSSVLAGLALLSPTAFGKSLLELASAAALRTAIALPNTTTIGRLARYTDTAGGLGETTALYEDGAGNIGIGITPTNPFHVRGNARVQNVAGSDIYYDIMTTDAKNAYLRFLTAGSTRRVIGIDAANSSLKIGNYAENDFANPAFTLLSDNKFGFGVTPAFKLDIGGTSSPNDRKLGINGTAANASSQRPLSIRVA